MDAGLHSSFRGRAGKAQVKHRGRSSLARYFIDVDGGACDALRETWSFLEKRAGRPQAG